MRAATALALDGDLTITSAAAHHAALLAAIAEPGDALALDLDAIESCDSAGVQLLIAARRSLAAQGRTLRLERMSSSVVQALRTYGLEAMFRSQQGGLE